MHTIYARINNVSAFLSTCTMVLLAAIALSQFLFAADPKGHLALSSINVYNAKMRRSSKQQEATFVTFNFTADLSPLFNWNTKQLFLYLSAEYEDKKGTLNEVVIWDHILRRKEDANLNVSGRNKYVFRDMSTSFRNARPANYSLKYNVMPYVGALTYGEVARTSEPIPFPEKHDLS